MLIGGKHPPALISPSRELGHKLRKEERKNYVLKLWFKSRNIWPGHQIYICVTDWRNSSSFSLCDGDGSRSLARCIAEIDMAVMYAATFLPSFFTVGDVGCPIISDGAKQC